MQVWFDEKEKDSYRAKFPTEPVYEKECQDPKCGKKFWTTSRNQKYCCTECQQRMKVVVKKKSKRKAERRKAYDANAEINRTLSACYGLAHKVDETFGGSKRCYFHGCGCNGPLQLHHKNLNVYDNSPWNVVWLCNSHHKMLHDTIPDINHVDTFNQAKEEAGFADETTSAQYEAKCEYLRKKLEIVPEWEECVRRTREVIDANKAKDKEEK